MLESIKKEVKEEIENLYKSGLSIAKVAKETGVAGTQVRRVLRARNVETRSLRINAELEKQIFEEYNAGNGAGFGAESIAKKYNLEAGTIRRIVRRLGGEIRRRGECNRRYPINHDFFDEIDTEEKAYFLGFMMADGHISKRKRGFSIVLHKKDEHILHEFRNLIYTTKDLVPELVETENKYKRLNVTSVKLVQGLIKHGCVPAKTFKTTMPDISKDLERHFIRGVFDGDGGISIGKNNRMRLYLTGYSLFLKEIKRWFEEKGTTGGAFSDYKRCVNVSDLFYSSFDDLNLILNLLYKDSNISLNRKKALYERCLILLEELKEKRDKIPVRYATNIFSYKNSRVTGAYLNKLSIEERKPIAEAVFEYYRKHGFPYETHTPEVLASDFAKLQGVYPTIKDGVILNGSNAGYKIFKHYCPHYYEVRSPRLLSIYDAFHDDELLMRSVNNRMGITYKETFNITGNMIKQGFRNGHIAFAASVFKPSVAKFVYDTYCDKNSRVLDISAGFGQRMMAAAASGNVVHYTGIDPWKKQIDALTEMHDNEFPEFSINLLNVGSEVADLDRRYDLCFSSPPFYNKEIYTKELSQAYANKGFEEFLEGWWVGTAKRVYEALRGNGRFILNMSSDMYTGMRGLVDGMFREAGSFHIGFVRGHVGVDAKDMFYILEKI